MQELEAWQENPNAWKHTPAKPPKPPKPAKIEYDDAHECPCCGGKGFVQITEEPSPKKRTRLKDVE